MAKNSNSNRTTLWDDPVAYGDSASQQAGAAASRGAWRAPSAVLSGDRPSRRVVSAMPPVAPDKVAAAEDEYGDLDGAAASDRNGGIPRRSKFVGGRSSAFPRTWWRPRSTFGRVLLGTAALMGMAAVIAGGVVTRNFLTRDAHFRIPGAASIQSSGLSEVNRAEVLPVFGEDIGRNIFFVPLSERRKQLEAIPWVQQATVMRFLPDRLSVSIVERTPVAFVRQGGQVQLADADGVILSMPPAMMAQHHYSFPVVTGINAEDSPAARRARMAVYQRFVAELDQNQQHLTEQVSEIDLSDPEDLRAVMPEQGSDILAHFGEDQFLQRLRVYKQHIGEWRGRYPKLIGVDLRYNGEVPLEMATGEPGTDSPSATKITALGDIRTTAAKAVAKAEIKPAAPKAKPVAKVVMPVKSSLAKTAEAHKSLEAHKSAEARKKAAQLKAAKLRTEKAKAAAHTKSSVSPAAHAATHSAPAMKQGQ